MSDTAKQPDEELEAILTTLIMTYNQRVKMSYYKNIETIRQALAALKAREQRIALESRIDQLQADIILTKESIGTAQLGLMQERLAELTAQLTQLRADTKQSESEE